MTWFIDHDHFERDLAMKRVGTWGEVYEGDGNRLNLGEKVRFRVYDDDDILMYSGWLHNDDECLNQMEALRFAAADVGATKIEVKLHGKWVQEIG